MSNDPQQDRMCGRRDAIQPNDSAPPVPLPDHIGLVMIPGTGRLVWWTGRVAIGLRHQPAPRTEPLSQSAMWVQKLMLGRSWKALVG